MSWQAEAELTALTTFGVPAKAQYLCAIRQEDELPVALAQAEHKDLPVTVLGGGSNMLVHADVPGLVLHMQLQGIRHRPDPDNADCILVTAAAGENWHTLVSYCLGQGWHGLENLALIPGSVGAAPVQNIGAYGVELADVLVSVRYFDTEFVQVRELSNIECEFSYRDSIFKQKLKNKAVILSCTLRLSRAPRVVVRYPALMQYLQHRGAGDSTSPQQVFEAVCDIRRSKLPDPAVIGNAGSFFRNPVLSAGAFAQLQKINSAVPFFETDTSDVKVPAAWLIDQAGWKGVRRGPVGVHDQQALVLVNHGGGTGVQILALAHEIVQSVQQKFAVCLEPEVCILPPLAGEL